MGNARPADDDYRLMLNQVTIERLADGIEWIDEDGRFVFVNPAATRLLGYSAEELTSMWVGDLDPNVDRARWRQIWNDVMERGSFTLEAVNRTKSGAEIHIEVTVHFVEYGGRRFNCSVVRDLTERRRVERELRSLNDRIHQLSITDALTGLANRRQFDLMLATEIARHAASGEPLSLILFDVDMFKAYNDTYGHVAGDEVLRRIGEAIRVAISGPVVTVARYGGEEIACILPETDGTACLELAELCRCTITALAIPHGASAVAGHVTASFGVMTTRCEAETLAVELLRRVDIALYAAKRQGRDRVVAEASLL